MFDISEIVIALCELRLNWKMNTWIMALIGIIPLYLKTILKTRQHCHGGANLGHEIKWNIFQWKPESVLFSGVRLSLRIQGWALKNARRLALSANPAVPSVEKCEKNEAECQLKVPKCWDPYRSGTKFYCWGWALESKAERWLPDFMCLLFWCVSLH